VRILTKPGRLTDAEFDVIKQHPTTGFRRLAPRGDLTFGQLMMVYQHHERLDGQGYPVGSCDDEIHPWARLCAVADVFEAVTSHRPYRAPMSPAEAMQILEKQSGKGLETEMVRCWQSILNNS
jgi:HD-GYP domain-containing protein (c-di-GMP phosphodiesterase class II)